MSATSRISYRDPFGPMDISMFADVESSYPHLYQIFKAGWVKEIQRGKSFVELPRIFQWLIVGRGVAKRKLNSVDQALGTIQKKIDNSVQIGKLKKRIQNISRIKRDEQLFQAFSEIIVIANLLEMEEISDFVYEKERGPGIARIDVECRRNGEKYYVEIFHKEDWDQPMKWAELLRITFKYIAPNIGGEIEYKTPFPPFEEKSEERLLKFPKQAFREIIERFKKVLVDFDRGTADQREFSYVLTKACLKFEIVVEKSASAWLLGGSETACRQPNIRQHCERIIDRILRFKGIQKNGYRIIAMDLNPGSHFHDPGYYRDKLIECVSGYLKDNRDLVDEIVSFSARFEDRSFDTLQTLWLAEHLKDSPFSKLT
jgi:hypothetical protein